jgi:hypothetical protein
MLSIRILPEEHSSVLSRQFKIVLLPAPVRPTIPTLSPLFIFKEIPFKTGGRFY